MSAPLPIMSRENTIARLIIDKDKHLHLLLLEEDGPNIDFISCCECMTSALNYLSDVCGL